MSSAATAIATHPSSSTTSLPNLSFDYHSLKNINLSFKPTSIKPPNLRKQFTSYPPFYLFSRFHSVCASTVAFADGFEETQNVQISETEEEEEDDEEEDEELEGETEDDEFDEGVVSQESEERRLYVGNLPYSMTSKQLADIFAQAGNVITVEIIYDRVTDRSRGFAFVTMRSVEEANEAIRMFNGSQVEGRTVRVNIPEVPKGGEKEVMRPKIKSSYQGFVDSPHKIYAGNLSWNLTSQGLREAFASQSGLLSSKVVYDRDSGRSRGFGFVTFGSAEEVESALNAMNGVEIEGRPLRLNLAEQRASVSPPLVTENNSENVLNESIAETNSENVLTESEVTSSASTWKKVA